MHTHEMHIYEMHAREMRCTPVRCMPMITPIRHTSMRYMSAKYALYQRGATTIKGGCGDYQWGGATIIPGGVRRITAPRKPQDVAASLLSSANCILRTTTSTTLVHSRHWWRNVCY